jgi:hypothetical protein
VLDHLDARLAPLSGRLADEAREMLAQADAAIDALAEQSQARRDQQARRLADLFGDTVAFAAMTIEADFEAARGDLRKTLIADLFAARRAAPAEPVALVADGFQAVPDLYPTLFGEGPLTQAAYEAI